MRLFIVHRLSTIFDGYSFGIIFGLGKVIEISFPDISIEGCHEVNLEGLVKGSNILSMVMSVY